MNIILTLFLLHALFKSYAVAEANTEGEAFVTNGTKRVGTLLSLPCFLFENKLNIDCA